MCCTLTKLRCWSKTLGVPFFFSVISLLSKGDSWTVGTSSAQVSNLADCLDGMERNRGSGKAKEEVFASKLFGSWDVGTYSIQHRPFDC